MRRRTGCLAGAVAVVCALFAARAQATPRPLPFTYTTETLGQGELEVEELTDLTPVVGQTSNLALQAYWATQFQAEFEYGITDRLELGLYIVYVPKPGGLATSAPMTEVTGIKQRLRYVFADPGAWPIDVGVYGELVEGDAEAEIEAKILLQRRIGRLRIDANLWGEIEREYNTGTTVVPGPDPGSKTLHGECFFCAVDYVINPTLAATYQITPVFHLGYEGWLRAEYPVPAPPSRPPLALGPVVYTGPTMLVDFGKVWWSAGFYFRANHFDRDLVPGDTYGQVWLRTIIGLNL